MLIKGLLAYRRADQNCLADSWDLSDYFYAPMALLAKPKLRKAIAVLLPRVSQPSVCINHDKLSGFEELEKRFASHPFRLFIFQNGNYSVVIIASESYPLNAARKCGLEGLALCDRGITPQQLESLRKKAEDISKFDPVERAAAGLNETKEMLFLATESLLQRGEKLDDLLEKCELLDDSAAEFKKSAKKMNRCCWLF